MEEKKLIIIAGPCSAESESQILETAIALANTNSISYYRAGLWKPRTRPHTFEGVGAIGIPWLQKVKEITGIPVIVEVAQPQHLELVIQAGIDAIWIGARTTTSPFAVQALADALKGCSDIPVFVKNPVNPDIQLWIGAIERIQNAGVTHIYAIHRGFSGVEKGNFRNPPQWQIAIEFKRLREDIPLLCDPSHICGNTNMLASVAQQALDLNMQGLMFEVHINPAAALSDAAQQITPAAFQQLMKQLVVRKENCSNYFFEYMLEEYRRQIDKIDTELIQLLAQRMSFIAKIANLKK
ncbi:MAG: bifunctional 3-deoxy-7-phosphoheptulonate synthase/chorismate mutase type II, partial [Bacteroidia bacterium]|nr:bifunctional 3-deoxy-7-phosphoheptulonate synthase/chorismate mutase type II [Bacteroidia bacterium]